MTELIDAFGHIMPQPVYQEFMERHPTDMIRSHNAPHFWNIESRLADMDNFGIDKQVLTLASPPSWRGIDRDTAIEITRLANDAIRDIADQHPDRFIPVGTLPFIDGIFLDELDRCMKELNMAGIQIFSNIDSTPLDAEQHLEFFAKVDATGIPVWMHPQLSDYSITGDSVFYAKVFGWLFDTSVALSRLVFSGIMEEFENIHLIPHHMGGMIPHFADRISTFYEARDFYPHNGWADLSQPMTDYFKRFYGDTVLNGSVSSLECGYNFYGADQIVFATDYPYGPEEGRKWLREIPRSIRDMDISQDEQKSIFNQNITQLIS